MPWWWVSVKVCQILKQVVSPLVGEAMARPAGWLCCQTCITLVFMGMLPLVGTCEPLTSAMADITLWRCLQYAWAQADLASIDR